MRRVVILSTSSSENLDGVGRNTQENVVTASTVRRISFSSKRWTCLEASQDHWKHLGTTNVVESPFAALRLRTMAAKRFKRVESATALIWKLLLVADKRFRRLDAPHLLKDVFEGRKFEDGKPVSTQQRKNAA